MNSNFLGIAIPTYKREELLGRLLNSIPDGPSIIVCDNGGHLSGSFKKKYTKVRFIVETEASSARNWNRAASALDTEWIVMPGDDDLYYKNSFCDVAEELQRYPTSMIALFGHYTIDYQDNIISKWQPSNSIAEAPFGFDKIKYGVEARPPSIFFRSELYKQLGGFNENFNVTAADCHFYQRASLIGATLYSNKIVSGYRVWDSSATNLMITSHDWMVDIDYWTRDIQKFAQKHTKYNYKDALRDEVFLRNMLSGIVAFKLRNRYTDAWRHLLEHRYPYRASLATQIKLLAHLMLP